MPTPSAARDMLRDLDVQAAKVAWAEDDDATVLVMLHVARTAARSVPFDLRAYSHRWLVDRGLPSQLPDQLKPRAERIYPRVVSAVGIAVRARSPESQGAVSEIQRSMQDAVLDAEADGRLTDDVFVKARIMEARARARKRLFG